MARRPTIASLTAEVEALRASLANVKRDFVPIEEYRRVQGVLRTTQQFLAKYKALAGVERRRPARPDKAALEAFFAAHPDRKSVTPAELAAFAAR